MQAKNDMDKAINDCDKMKSEFIIATDEFNRVQREYYNTDQLQLFNSLQSMTEVGVGDWDESGPGRDGPRETGSLAVVPFVASAFPPHPNRSIALPSSSQRHQRPRTHFSPTLLLPSPQQDRIRQHGQFIVLYSRSEREVLPVVTRCLDAVDLKAQAVDAVC